jgi:hypothetical protein
LMMEIVYSSEILVLNDQTTWNQKPEDQNINPNGC